MSNSSFYKARKNKNDEFYTQYETVDDELRYYDRSQFKDKVVYCPCDDYRSSNFYKYLRDNFKSLGLKKLMATNYSPEGNSWLAEYDGGQESVRRLSEKEAGNGDFRWPKVQSLMKEADVVVTNPPFSLFREFVSAVRRSQSDYILLGNLNAISYRDVFTLLKDGEMRLGAISNQSVVFEVPESYGERPKTKRIDGRYYSEVGSITSYTSMTHTRKHQKLSLTRKYDPDKYPKYDNYDAIEVGRVADIPIDYEGEMGVPITYLTKHDDEGFDLVGSDRTLEVKGGACYVNGQRKYARTIIRRKAQFSIKGTNRSLGMNALYIDGQEKYRRIIIQRKAPLDDGGP